jgi:hypothetical protein
VFFFLVVSCYLVFSCSLDIIFFSGWRFAAHNALSPFVPHTFHEVYKGYATSSINMWQVPSQLALFGTIDDASFRMFTNILKRMHIPTVHMNNFVQKMKTDKSSLHISLMLIKECAAQFGTLLPAPWTVIFCHPSNTAPIPTLESWRLILEMLSQAEAVEYLRPLDTDNDCRSKLSEKFSDDTTIARLFVDHVDARLLLSCSIFGNKRLSWLLTHWNDSTKPLDLAYLILSTTIHADDINLLKVLQKIPTQDQGFLGTTTSSRKSSECLLGYAFTLGCRMTYTSPKIAWECIYLLLCKSDSSDMSDIDDEKIDEIERNMCNICLLSLAGSTSDTNALQFTLACANNFIALIARTGFRNPLVKLDTETVMSIKSFGKSHLHVHFEQIMYR